MASEQNGPTYLYTCIRTTCSAYDRTVSSDQRPAGRTRLADRPPLTCRECGGPMGFVVAEAS